jgi:hypothetical protein
LRHSLARSCAREVEGLHAYQFGLYIGSGTLRRLGDAYYLVLDFRDSALRRGEDGVQELRLRVPFIVRAWRPSGDALGVVLVRGAVFAGEAMVPSRRLEFRVKERWAGTCRAWNCPLGVRSVHRAAAEAATGGVSVRRASPW